MRVNYIVTSSLSIHRNQELQRFIMISRKQRFPFAEHELD